MRTLRVAVFAAFIAAALGMLQIGGARAAAETAPMAPQTNIGSATPIDSTGQDIKGALGRKVRNDAAAYVRAVTSSHGRNADVAEQMVRKATNMEASKALESHLVDVVASNQTEL